MQGGQDWGGRATEAETEPKITHRYQHQISEKIYQRIFQAALFEFNYNLFKILLIKNIPNPYSYLVQLQFAFKRSLKNGVPLHGKRNFALQVFFGEESP